MNLSLVIPCYNEADNLPLLLERCRALGACDGVEVILVDNGSTDASPAILQRLIPEYKGCRSVRVDVNRGYGFGVIAGLKSAKGDVLGWTHADMQTDPHDALAGFLYFKDNPEAVFVKGKRYGRPAMDVLFTVGMSLFESALFARPMWDINAQPTLFSRQFYEKWKSPPSDFALDLYVYHQAVMQGLEVRRFPVQFGVRAHGVSHWNVSWSAKMKFIRRTLWYSVKLRRNTLK